MSDNEILAVFARGTYRLVKTKQGGVFGDERTPLTVGFCYDPERTTVNPAACIGKRNDGGYTLNLNANIPGGMEAVVVRFEDIEDIVP